MIKIFNVFLFIFAFASCVFVNGKVSADFSSRHSLMPTSAEEAENKPSDVVTLNEVEKKEEVAVVEDNVDDGILVDDGTESFFLKRPSGNANFSNNQNFKDDFSASGPKLDKPEGYDELMQMVREQGGVMKPSSYADDGKGNLVLKNTDETGSKPVVSNVIDERKEDVIVKPLFVGKKNKEKVKTEKSSRPIPLANLKPKKVGTKTVSKSPSKPVRRRSFDTDEIEIYSSDKVNNIDYENRAVVHVASYNTEESAEKGFDVIVKKYSVAESLEPFIRYEVVEGKGYYWRLYLLGDEKDVEYLCHEMKSNGDWCNILK